VTTALTAFANRPAPVQYRYYFTDFRSGRLLAILPCTGVSLSDALRGAASGKANVPLVSSAVRNLDPFTATVPRRTCLWAERQILDPAPRQGAPASIPWGGVIMGRSRSRSARGLALSLVSWPSYFGNRLVGDHAYTQADTFRIWRELVAASVTQPTVAGLPAVPPALTNLAVTTGPASGILADRTYLASDLKPTLTEMTALGNSGSGFDWRFTYYRDSTVPTVGESFRVNVDLGAPRLGRPASPALRWSSRREDNRSGWGYVEDYTVDEDGSAVYNRLIAMGSGQGPDQLRADVDARQVGADEIGYGFPRYESSLMSSTEDLRTQDSVDAHALGKMRAGLAGAFRITGIKVRGDLGPTVDTYSLGDDATLWLDETTIGQEATFVGQIVGRTIDPPEQGRSETVTLDVQGSLVG
jgi:hypothetical protein